MDNGFAKGIATLILADHLPQYILVSASEQSIADAIQWVCKHNPSLKFDRKEMEEKITDSLIADVKIVKLHFMPAG